MKKACLAICLFLGLAGIAKADHCNVNVAVVRNVAVATPVFAVAHPVFNVVQTVVEVPVVRVQRVVQVQNVVKVQKVVQVRQVRQIVNVRNHR